MKKLFVTVAILCAVLTVTVLPHKVQAATADYFDTVQKVYVGYYQRPADPGGLLYWAQKLAAANGNLSEIIEAYANSAESQALYGTINSGTISSVINAIYRTLFGRDAETGGLNYYVNGFNLGQFTAATIMLNVLYGAQNEDLQSINDKLAAAHIFTRTIDPELDGIGFLYNYSGDAVAQSARGFLSAVTSDPTTIPTQSDIGAFFSPTQAIQDLYARMKALVEAHNTDGLMGLIARDYFHDGAALSDLLADPPNLSNIQTFDFAITNIVISGNTAKVYGTCTITYNDGSPSESWSEPDMATTDSGGLALGWLGKTTAGWAVYGNQIRAAASFTTGHNTTPGDDHYFFRVRTTGSLPITTITFSGPNAPATLLAPDPVWGGYKAFVEPSPIPPVGTEYTFTIDFADGVRQVLYDTVTAYVPVGPSFTVIPGSGTMTINWSDVSSFVPNASHYWVSVHGDGVDWWSDDLPLTRKSAVFNENGTTQGILQSGKTYLVSVSIFNKTDDYAYQIRDFVMP
jgi:hypothetical protein